MLPQVFPSLHVIHQVQDGRDFALRSFAPQHKREEDQIEHFFVQTFAGQGVHVPGEPLSVFAVQVGAYAGRAAALVSFNVLTSCM